MIENDLDLFDGYDEIDGDSQLKVRKALEDGHVADDDWRGVGSKLQETGKCAKRTQDVTQNRPGAKGFRSPANKKEMRKAAKAEREALKVRVFRSSFRTLFCV